MHPSAISVKVFPGKNWRMLEGKRVQGISIETK